MAKKKEPTTALERMYVVPLRRDFLKAPRWKRTNRAVKSLKEFASKHMKSEKVNPITTASIRDLLLHRV